ncbi:4737_t:CDS:2 [Paraglomus occultum]|uniref:4737_t:CDS:1 n=1 Tax=Paraglomus occultum TaxID=144539 RepID=A0A9N9C352_9GLOM|nr:4737_t:CDS:2 [Paraglomus occultum]
MDESRRFVPSRPAPTPPNTPRRLNNFSSLQTLLLHRTLNPRISKEHQNVIKVRLRVALEVEFREKRLREAAARGDMEAMTSLITTNPPLDLNKPDDKGRTPLHFACASGHEGVVKLLIERGANVNAEPDVAGNRPLHLAVIASKLDCVVLLLEAGAKINTDDTFTKTPLALARSRLNILMKNMLTSPGSNNEIATMDIEEIADQDSLAQREAFRQVLHITKILRHYLSYEITSPKETQAADEASQTMEALDVITNQLSQLAMSDDNGQTSRDHQDGVLNHVQNVLDNIIRKQN